MPVLPTGTLAPNFSLTDADGKQFSLSENLTRGPVILAFFKISCPTSHFTFPFLDRIYRAYGRKPNMVGISQNPPDETRLFTTTFDLSFPVLFDPPDAYPVSNAYGIDFVPSIFLISSKGSIEISSEGWARADLEQLNQSVARFLGVEPVQIFLEGEDIPNFRHGCGAMN